MVITNNKFKFNSILDSSLVPKNNQVLINILTRTSNRPSYFAECRNSIVNQSYKNIRHIVSVDDETTYQYVKENGLLDQNIIQLERPDRINFSHMPYNLYMNNLLKEVNNGWILFLDDDDILYDINSILIMVNNLPREPAILIFKTRIGGKNLPEMYFKKKIVKGDITSNCFIFHSSLKNNSYWIDQKGSDFFFLDLLSQNSKIFWLNLVLTKVNNQKIMGRGSRQDKNLTILRQQKLLLDNNFLDKINYFLNYNNKITLSLLQKDYIHQYFDHIYILNLERRIDKFCKTVNRLQNNNIFNFERFLGIDGKLPEIKNRYNYYLQLLSKNQYKNNDYIPSSGSYAILLSMKNMLNDAIKNKYQKILVLQDDIVLISNFKLLLSSYKQVLNSDWKLIYLGASQHNWKNIEFDFKKRIYYCFGTDGAFALGINCNIFNLLIRLIDNATLPFDSGPLTHIQKMYCQDCFVLFPNLIIADVSESDCRKSRDQEEMNQKFKWHQKYDFDFYNKNNFVEPICQKRSITSIQNNDFLVTIIVFFNKLNISNMNINYFLECLEYQTYPNFELIVLLEKKNQKENEQIYQKINNLIMFKNKKKIKIQYVVNNTSCSLFNYYDEIEKLSEGDYLLFINNHFYFYNNILEYLLSFIINYPQFSGCFFSKINSVKSLQNITDQLFESSLFLISKNIIIKQISKIEFTKMSGFLELINKLKCFNYRFYWLKDNSNDILKLNNLNIAENYYHLNMV